MTVRGGWLLGVLALFGIVTLCLGLTMAIAPAAFFDTLGPFGGRNDHYIRDNATFNLATGALLLVALRRPTWRTPALAFTAFQWALHAANHLIDIDEAEPGWVGVFDFVSLLLGVAVLVVALVISVDADRARRELAD